MIGKIEWSLYTLSSDLHKHTYHGMHPGPSHKNKQTNKPRNKQVLEEKRDKEQGEDGAYRRMMDRTEGKAMQDSLERAVERHRPGHACLTKPYIVKYSLACVGESPWL